MSEPSTNRKDLRRQICRMARMDFFRRYDAGEVSLTGVPTTTSLPSTSLVQSATNHWAGGWAYLPGTGEARRITAFTPTTDTLTLEYPLSGAPTGGDKLEIIELWSPSAIHQAINRAIDIAARLYPLTTQDDAFYLPESGIVDLSARTPPIRTLNRVWADPNTILAVGTVASCSFGSGTLTLTTTDLDVTADDQYNGYTLRLPLYGSLVTLTVTDTVRGADGTHTLTCATASDPTSNIDVGDSFYLVPVVSNPTRTWYELNHVRLDSEEWPNTLMVEQFPADLTGARLILDYTTLPGALDSDTDTTIVPAEYILRRALALLHEDVINDNRADVTRHQQLAQYFHSQADQFMTAFATQRQPMGQRFSSGASFVTGNQNDPLNWRNDG